MKQKAALERAVTLDVPFAVHYTPPGECVANFGFVQELKWKIKCLTILVNASVGQLNVAFILQGSHKNKTKTTENADGPGASMMGF